MDKRKLNSVVSGNPDILKQLQDKMPARSKPKDGKVTHNAVIIAWKEAYGEHSSSFTGKLTVKDESLLKHISKDYPSDAVGLIEYCVSEWQQFGNEVIRLKGLQMAPQLPSIAFLSAHREIAHAFYKKAQGEPVVSHEEVSTDSPVPSLPQGNGFVSADSFFDED